MLQNYVASGNAAPEFVTPPTIPVDGSRRPKRPAPAPGPIIIPDDVIMGSRSVVEDEIMRSPKPGFSDHDIVVVPMPKPSRPIPTGGKSNARPNDNSSVYPLQYDTPPGFSDYSNQPGLLVNVDWLALRLHETVNAELFVDGLFEKGDYRFELLGYGSQFFQHIANVYHGKDLIGQLQFGSRQETLKESMVFKYENWLFYDSTWMTVCRKYLFSHFFAALETRVLNVSRLDIAVDGVFLNGFMESYRARAFDKLKVLNVMYRMFDDPKKDSNGFTVGKRDGKKFAVYYNKTEEIAERDYKKQYILDYFTANGFDVSKPVYRFELRLNSEAMRDMAGFEFTESIFEPSALADIFTFHLQNFFEFVPSESTDSRRSRRDKVRLFNFSGLKRAYVKVKRALLNGVRTVKVIAKRLIGECWDDDGENVVNKLKSVAELLDKNSLWGWLSEKSDQIYKDLNRKGYLHGTPCNALFDGRNLAFVTQNI